MQDERHVLADRQAAILCGDAATVLATLPADFARLTVTSPPYYRHKDYRIEGQIGQEPSLALYVERLRSVLAELFRVTTPDGACFVVIGDSYRRGSLMLVPHRIALAASEVGWVVRNDIIWRKTDPAPDSPRNRWRTCHEHVLFLTRQAKGYRFNDSAIRQPYSDETIRRWGNGQRYGGPKSEKRASERDTRFRHGKSFLLNPDGVIPPDVWIHPSSRSTTLHYATFPAGLVRPVIAACSDPGDLVTDPFAGSGTTCVLAREMDRRCLGIELNPEYASMAQDAVGKIGK
ncbi:MAG: site-specific DNA-methyltransferase [Planctomycetota bacterium]|nr:site-specific DNA-methyltransferase [Planctomycetaceae bacterium]MDQ3330747.1 site-specific DNA-methyltransferase [Planctomycetota bacterium]